MLSWIYKEKIQKKNEKDDDTVEISQGRCSDALTRISGKKIPIITYFSKQRDK